MGSTNFECSVNSISVDEAFRLAVDDAFYWHGHNGYTGTICEKAGYVVLDLGEKISLSEAQKIADGLCMAWSNIPVPEDVVKIIGSEERAKEFADIYNDKWGDAIAMQLVGNSWFFCGLAPE